MGKKRKRPGRSSHWAGPDSATPRRFRVSKGPVSSTVNNHGTSHPVISLYYREVVTLRQYLLQQLPVTSRSRRRRIVTLGSSQAYDLAESGDLANLLDSALVGVLKESSPSIDSERQRDYLAFTQSQSRSILLSTDTGPTCPQSEVVDFVIWKLFNNGSSYQKPQHMLAHGFQRPSIGSNAVGSNIPGIVVKFPNHNVHTLKEAPWADILGLLGSNGEEIMMRLLFDCGLFAAIDAKKGTFYQLSGLPLSALEPAGEACSQLGKSAFLRGAVTAADGRKAAKRNIHRKDNRGLNSIVLLRRRMLYARSCESKGFEWVGLGRTNVLNRFSSVDSMQQTVHVTKYIFPRQFGLRNVFTSPEDRRDGTVKHYAFREDEISQLGHKKRQYPFEQANAGDESTGHPKLPKRLRGHVSELVWNMRARQYRCPYGELLKHYCPSEPNSLWRLPARASQPGLGDTCSPLGSSMGEQLVTQMRTKHPSSADGGPRTPCQPSMSDSTKCLKESNENNRCYPTVPKPKTCLTDFATPAPAVSAFCRAVLQKIVPPQFYGTGMHGVSNRKLVLKHVDQFIKMRRFESLSLHEVCRGLKVTNIPWLEPPQLQKAASGAKHNLSLTDFQKRTELLYEFIYFVFDSILIPLIRSTFYVTESQTHRNRLFYFRHDVWRRLTEQPLADLKASMFEELEPGRAQQVLARRSLGFGALRLLPKSSGLRPILNLRKRVLKETIWGGRRRSFLAPSINSSITPIYNMLAYERQRTPAKMGSSLQSVGEIYLQLKRFKDQLFGRLSQLPPRMQETRPKRPPLFFVKLDIQACFDSIPQKRLIQVIENLASEQNYRISKHLEIQAPTSAAQRGKMSRKFVGRAAPATQPQHLPDFIANGSHGRHANTVFVETGNQKIHGAEELLDLLDEHVRKNLVKIGKKYFRQRSGIPQGSVLSSLLCNFFYAELEREVLGFLRPEDALLLRLVDDFLLITADVSLATQFLQIMIRGQPSYGISVNPSKSLLNFTAAVDGIHIPRLEGSSLFPYLGCLIDTHTLEIHRDQDRVLEGDSAAAAFSNSLTIETTRMPGQAFHRKVLTSFRLQMQAMYLDDAHNSRSVVLANLYTSFITSAMKMYRYMKSLPGRAHPGAPVVIRTIHDLIQQASGMIQARRAGGSSSGFACTIQRSQLRYLAATAFRFVLARKQTRYAAVLRWLDSLTREVRPASVSQARQMAQVVRRGNMVFGGWRF